MRNPDDRDDPAGDAASPQTTIDDAQLLRRHLDGDPDAFTQIVRRYRDRLWAVAIRTMGDPDEAADALQDALISAMRHADSFRGEALLSTWLHRIVVNACLDRLRRRAARPTVGLPDDDHSPLVRADHDEYAERELAADVHAALATLSHDQRAAVVLVDIEGYPVDEAAAMLDVPSGTVKSRCARARAKLMPLLAHLDGRSGTQSSAARSAGNPNGGNAVEPPMTAPREDLG